MQGQVRQSKYQIVPNIYEQPHFPGSPSSSLKPTIITSHTIYMVTMKLAVATALALSLTSEAHTIFQVSD
jgi:hypothetical protein